MGANRPKVLDMVKISRLFRSKYYPMTPERNPKEFAEYVKWEKERCTSLNVRTCKDLFGVKKSKFNRVLFNKNYEELH